MARIQNVSVDVVDCDKATAPCVYQPTEVQVGTANSESHSDVIIRVHAICLGAVGREVLQIAIDARVACCVSLLHSIDHSDPVFAGKKWILTWEL